MSKARVDVPAHLSDESKRFWRYVVENYAIEQHHRQILQDACESWDLATSCRAEILRDGLTQNGRPHPLIKCEREARAMHLRSLRELGLDLAQPEAPRPPVRTGRAR